LVTLDADTAQLVPCRMHLKPDNGKPVKPEGLPFWHDHFVCDGKAVLLLAPRLYTFEIERGPEHSVATGRFIVTAGAPLNLTNQLRRLVDLSREGWWSGETHVHRPPRDIELLMRAEDLHVAGLNTWWNDANPFAKQAPPDNPVVSFDGNRFYDLLGGEDERAGGALLYFGLKAPLPIAGSQREYPSPMKFLELARTKPGGWVDIEKPFWWDVPVWLASGLVDSVGLAHNHMHRRGVLDSEAWGKPRDVGQYAGTWGNALWTQQIYYHLLNAGLRLAPSAGSASGVLPNPVGYNRAYVHLAGGLTYEKWWQGLRTGRVFVSNGPLLRCHANGELPGHVFQGDAAGTLVLQLEANLDSREAVPALEIIRNGRVERRVAVTDSRHRGSLGQVQFRESGWFLVRAVAATRDTFRFASTGPFYVEVGNQPRRISRGSVQFFLDWARERLAQIKLPDAQQQAEVIRYHRQAVAFWENRLSAANAD
jgi:hypothetical protein